MGFISNWLKQRQFDRGFEYGATYCLKHGLPGAESLLCRIENSSVFEPLSFNGGALKAIYEYKKINRRLDHNQNMVRDAERFRLWLELMEEDPELLDKKLAECFSETDYRNALDLLLRIKTHDVGTIEVTSVIDGHYRAWFTDYEDAADWALSRYLTYNNLTQQTIEVRNKENSNG